MQQSIVKFIAFSYRYCSTCFKALQCPSSGARQTAVAASGFRMNVEVEVLTTRPRLRTLPPPHSYGNQKLQRQFYGLLMMGIVMPETCWAVSVRKGNKFYDWLLHLAGCFIRDINHCFLIIIFSVYNRNSMNWKCRENNWAPFPEILSYSTPHVSLT